MASFKTADGREWKLRLTVGSVADVKRETGVNLALTTKDNSWIDLLFSDQEKLGAVLWVLCEGQAKDAGITPEAFAHQFDGTTLEAAGEALAFAIADFFPRSRMAKALKEGLPKLMEEADKRGAAAIDRIVSTGLNSPTSSPVSSGSNPPF